MGVSRESTRSSWRLVSASNTGTRRRSLVAWRAIFNTVPHREHVLLLAKASIVLAVFQTKQISCDTFHKGWRSSRYRACSTGILLGESLHAAGCRRQIAGDTELPDLVDVLVGADVGAQEWRDQHSVGETFGGQRLRVGLEP